MAAKLKLLDFWFFFALMMVFASAEDNAFSVCNCDDEGGWSIASIMECQKVSDFLIAVAYFSIPIELLYFISFSNVPFKWVLLQFIAFIVLCGLTHLLNGWTYYGPHSFQLVMALTIAKVLTALVSCATAITLLTLFPMLLKIKVREIFLRQNVLELDQEVGLMKRQKEASQHVRMLTHEIRKSLDKHTILYTTLVELSKTLDLQNCAVWMPNGDKTEMNVTYELNPSSRENYQSLPINDPEVMGITKEKGVRILRQDSVLGTASSGGFAESGAVAAIRLPLLCFSNFKGGTPEFVETAYGILVLVLPGANDRQWNHNEMEIVEVVADQVAVALSHAAVLEESQSMMEKLKERNRVLHQARQNAMMASQARNAFQKVMSNGMRRPMHSISGLLSIAHGQNMSSDQRTIVSTMIKTSTVLSTLINDAMDISPRDTGSFPLEMRPFELHSMIREASCLIKCLCAYRGFGFSTDVQRLLPNHVVGDEKRTFQVLLHMIGHFLNISDGRGSATFRVLLESASEGRNDRFRGAPRLSITDDYVNVKFEIEVSIEGTHLGSSTSTFHSGGRRHNNKNIKEELSFNMCKKLVQMLQGGIWMSSNSTGSLNSMTLFLRFQKQSSYGIHMFEHRSPPEQRFSTSTFRGLQVILADDDDVNRMVTKKLLQKLGCEVSDVSSGLQCLSSLGSSATSFQVVMLDLHMPEMDGFEVAMNIRKFCSRNWPIIIALTASSEEQLWERCREVGMNGLIRKPVLLQSLADELRKVLQRGVEGL